jgi:hypothetical protein
MYLAEIGFKVIASPELYSVAKFGINGIGSSGFATLALVMNI